jgi:hypothetical protein
MKSIKVSTGFILLVILLFGFTTSSTFAQDHLRAADDLISDSDMVVVGQVSSIRSEWNDDRSYIFSHVTVAVEEFIKGERPERTITLRQLGGEVGDVGEIYSHTARFLPDEEILVFLKRDPRGDLQVTGGEHGKFQITTDSETGQRMVEGRVPLDNLTRDLRMILKE